ncbi:MAG: MFS transporter [Candidatus Obscuribacter sp.]|nr:MFS transporter [Candidatus Obscuribacter sp.]
MFFTTMMIALGFGFAIGDPIVSATGIGKAPYAVACGFFLAGLFVLRIKDNKRVVRHENLWWEDLRIGIAYIANNAIVFKAILKITFLFSTMITLNVIAVALSQQVMHLEASKFGYIVAAAGVGMGIGNFIVGHYLAHVNPSLMAHRGFGLLGLFMSLLGSLALSRNMSFLQSVCMGSTLMGTYVLSSLLAAMIGLSSAFVAVPTQSLLQASIPEDMRGKVFAAQNTAMSAASTIPVVLAGISADNIPGGVSTTLLIVGLPTLVMGLVNHARSAERISV